MAKVIWSDPALLQLEEILEYISLDKPDAARSVARRVLSLTDRVGVFTKLGKKVPELDNPAYRQVFIAPCWIYYRVDAEKVLILHVRRGERPLRESDLADL